MPIECSICMELLLQVGSRLSSTPCGHVYHRQCLLTWIENNQNNGSCPVCRANFEPFNVIPLLTLDDYDGPTSSASNNQQPDNPRSNQSSTLPTHIQNRFPSIPRPTTFGNTGTHYENTNSSKFEPFNVIPLLTLDDYDGPTSSASNNQQPDNPRKNQNSTFPTHIQNRFPSIPRPTTFGNTGTHYGNTNCSHHRNNQNQAVCGRGSDQPLRFGNSVHYGTNCSHTRGNENPSRFNNSVHYGDSCLRASNNEIGNAVRYTNCMQRNQDLQNRILDDNAISEIVSSLGEDELELNLRIS